MADADEAPKAATQLEFARIMDISQPAVHKLVRKGVLKTGHTLGQWLVEYGKHMAQVAAQWKSSDGIDRVEEAALLDRIKREEIQGRIDEKHGHSLPEDLFVDGVSATFTAIKVQMLGIPSKLRTGRPNLTTDDLVCIQDHIHQALLECTYDRFISSIRTRLEAKRTGAPSAVPANGKPMGRRKKKAKL